jgi:hypothetical protein
MEQRALRFAPYLVIATGEDVARIQPGPVSGSGVCSGASGDSDTEDDVDASCVPSNGLNRAAVPISVPIVGLDTAALHPDGAHVENVYDLVAVVYRIGSSVVGGEILVITG